MLNLPRYIKEKDALYNQKVIIVTNKTAIHVVEIMFTICGTRSFIQVFLLQLMILKYHKRHVKNVLQNQQYHFRNKLKKTSLFIFIRLHSLGCVYKYSHQYGLLFNIKALSNISCLHVNQKEVYENRDLLFIFMVIKQVTFYGVFSLVDQVYF